MVSRVERTPFADWWWTVDRLLLAALVVLMVAGIVLGMAGSPPVAERLGLPTFHFVNRQVVYLVPAVLVMLVVSFFSPRHVRRAALARLCRRHGAGRRRRCSSARRSRARGAGSRSPASPSSRRSS